MLRHSENGTAGAARMEPAHSGFEAHMAAARQARAEVMVAIGQAVGAWVKQRFAGLANAYRRRMAYDELNGLDDRMLRDLGLSRGELWAAVDGQARPTRSGSAASNDNRAAAAANDDSPRRGVA